jgi:hypothetical protein
MAISDMYDWLSIVNPATSTTLTLQPSSVTEEYNRNQQIRYGDDGSEERVTFGSADVTIMVTLNFSDLTEAEAGTFSNLYNNPDIGNGIVGTFAWINNAESDPNTYTVRFAEHLKRSIKPPFRFDLSAVKLKVLGKPTPA